MIELTDEVNKVEITLGQKLFEFNSFEQWVNWARHLFGKAGLIGGNYHICLDAKGRVCDSGKEFMRAQEDNSFPVAVYLKVFQEKRGDKK